MKNCLLVVFSLVFLIACENKRDKKAESESASLVPPSYLNVLINFPASEITVGLNEMMPKILMDGGIPINDKGDSAFIKINKVGSLDIKFRGDYAYASLPVKIKASIRKKVMGVTFSNEDVPLEFKAIAKAKVGVTLSSDWDLTLDCIWVDLDWKDNPNIKILGLNLDLGKKLDKMIKENQAEISGLLCGNLNERLNFKKTVNKVWDDLQKPIRISQKPVFVWLMTEPVSISAKLLPLSNDQLSIDVELRTQIRISPNKLAIHKPLPLPKREEPLDSKSAILSYVEVVIPYQLVEETLSKKMVGTEYSYEGYTILIEKISIGSELNQLLISVDVSGSVNGVIKLRGMPSLTKDKNLILKDLSFEVDLDDQIATVTDWAMHQFAESYLQDKLFFAADELMSNLDVQINQGISKSKVGDKISTNLNLSDIQSYQVFIGKDQLQWVLYTEGKADIQLKRGLFTAPK